MAASRPARAPIRAAVSDIVIAKAKDRQTRTGKTRPKIQVPYSSVAVLFISWKSDACDATLRETTGQLADVFDQLYHYTVEEIQIASRTAFRRSFTRQFLSFLKRHNQERGLIVIHYGGRAVSTPGQGSIWTPSCNCDGANSTFIDTALLMQLIEPTKADVLLLLESAESMPYFSSTPGACPLSCLAGAGSAERPTEPYEFTKALTRELTLAASRHEILSDTKLYTKLRERLLDPSGRVSSSKCTFARTTSLLLSGSETPKRIIICPRRRRKNRGPFRLHGEAEGQSEDFLDSLDECDTLVADEEPLWNAQDLKAASENLSGTMVSEKFLLTVEDCMEVAVEAMKFLNTAKAHGMSLDEANKILGICNQSLQLKSGHEASVEVRPIIASETEPTPTSDSFPAPLRTWLVAGHDSLMHRSTPQKYSSDGSITPSVPGLATSSSLSDETSSAGTGSSPAAASFWCSPELEKFTRELLDSLVLAFLSRQEMDRRLAINAFGSQENSRSVSASFGSATGSTSPRQDSGRSSPSKRKRPSDPADREDGDGAGERGSKRPKRGTPEYRSQIFWACPFSKWKPLTYRHCNKYPIDSIAHVKQHLKRRHAPPIYCPRCFDEFPSSQARNEHQRGPPCPVRTRGSWDCMTEEQAELLRQRTDKDQCKEDQWFSIFRILFPDSPLPESPYLNREFSEQMEAFQDFLATDGMVMIDQLIQSRMPSNLRPQQGDVVNFVHFLFEHGVPRVIHQSLLKGHDRATDGAQLTLGKEGNKGIIHAPGNAPRLEYHLDQSDVGSGDNLLGGSGVWGSDIAPLPRFLDDTEGDMWFMHPDQ